MVMPSPIVRIYMAFPLTLPTADFICPILGYAAVTNSFYRRHWHKPFRNKGKVIIAGPPKKETNGVFM